MDKISNHPGVKMFRLFFNFSRQFLLIPIQWLSCVPNVPFKLLM